MVKPHSRNLLATSRRCHHTLGETAVADALERLGAVLAESFVFGLPRTETLHRQHVVHAFLDVAGEGALRRQHGLRAPSQHACERRDHEQIDRQRAHGEKGNGGRIGVRAEHRRESHRERGHGEDRLLHDGGNDAGNHFRVVHHPVHGIADGLVVQLGHGQGLHAAEEARAHEVNDGLLYSNVEQRHHVPVHESGEKTHHRQQGDPRHDQPCGRAFEHLHHRDQEGRIAGHVLDGGPENHVVDDDLAHPRGQYDGEILGNQVAHEADGVAEPHVPHKQHASANDPEGLAVVDIGLAVGETRAFVEGLLVLAQGAQGSSEAPRPFGFAFPGRASFVVRHRRGRPCRGRPSSPRIERTLGTGPPQCPSGPRDCRSPRCAPRRDRRFGPHGGRSKSGG